MRSRKHLRLVGAPAHATGCRTGGCPLRANGPLGFCRSCEAVYQAAQELREQLLALRGARLHAAHHVLFDALTPTVREGLLGHMAARTAQRGQAAHVFAQHGLEDFLRELDELGLTGGLR